MRYLPFIATFLLGLAISFVVTRPDAEPHDDAGRATEGRSRDSRIRQSPKPNLHWLQSAGVAMESRHRHTLRSELLRDWAKSDPIGFLAAWRERAWSDGGYYNPGETALDRYAAIDPAGLLDYARAEGCTSAWFAYLKGVSPHAALGLLDEIDPSEFPEKWWAELVRQGMAIDPDFHLHVADIANPELRNEAVTEVAASMLSTRRVGDLVAFIAGVEPLPELLDDLARMAGQQMIEGNLSVAELAIFPEEFRDPSILALLTHQTPKFMGLFERRGSARTAPSCSCQVAHAGQ